MESTQDAATPTQATPSERDDSEHLRAAITAARSTETPIIIRGTGSKAFLAPSATSSAASLSTLRHTGIVAYRPDELVVTARSGMALDELDRALHGQGQMLPCDPPRFGGSGTVGGAVATGLAGPGRPWLGSVRDAVLGVHVVNGLGERLAFGGQVLKNVAGYDVSRLMTGAFGTLGLLLQVSMRVQPMPEAVAVLAKPCTADAGAAIVRGILRAPLPVTATCHVDGVLRIRLAGSPAGVRHARDALGLDIAPEDDGFFDAVRDHRHPFFDRADGTLWRLSLPRGAAFAAPDALIEWAGAQTWWWTDADDDTVQTEARAHQGFATKWGGGGPLRASPAIAKYMQRVKAAFDPDGILNPRATADAD